MAEWPIYQSILYMSFCKPQTGFNWVQLTIRCLAVNALPAKLMKWEADIKSMAMSLLCWGEQENRNKQDKQIMFKTRSRSRHMYVCVRIRPIFCGRKSSLSLYFFWLNFLLWFSSSIFFIIFIYFHQPPPSLDRSSSFSFYVIINIIIITISSASISNSFSIEIWKISHPFNGLIIRNERGIKEIWLEVKIILLRFECLPFKWTDKWFVYDWGMGMITE